MEPEKLWQSTLGEMEIQLTKANFAMWLRDSRLVDRKEGTLYVALPSNFAKTWIEDKYQKNILGILRNMDSSVKKVEFVINPQAPARGEKQVMDMKELNKIDAAELDFGKTDPETNLNPRYTMSSFVVGPSNELAYAAAKAIVENVGKYNPFFIYGGVGLGKTHLIQSIGNEIFNKYQKKIKPKYVASEQYTRDVVWGLRNDRIESVKKKYRDADILIIDDIQFIGGKEKTEEEFFHTFNALYEANKQIIISSDRPPQSIPTLEERLRSRFEGGFVADIGYPEYEMRVAIIRGKLAEANKSLDDDVVDIIAKRLRKNIRELEGVLKKLLFLQEQRHVEITKDLAEEVIEKSTKNMSRRVNDAQILKVVADFFSVSVEDLVSHNRRKEVVLPRQIAMYLLREISDLSYPYIGDKMGRDHTTAIHSYEKINQEINRSPALNQKILTIKEIIYKG
ncbi:MAG TPA: chromosomal replication initiator protein DnaA [Candidatus Paceibacterota bacterium]|jgi:chromosomal replication initiator protein|nr:chromosomal replication initiator protein DnaA [Candidatus Paceibacterota bacterium]